MNGWFELTQQVPGLLVEMKRKYFGSEYYDDVLNLEKCFNGLMATGPFKKEDLMKAYDFLHQQEPEGNDVFIDLFDFLYSGG